MLVVMDPFITEVNCNFNNYRAHHNSPVYPKSIEVVGFSTNTDTIPLLLMQWAILFVPVNNQFHYCPLRHLLHIASRRQNGNNAGNHALRSHQLKMGQETLGTKRTCFIVAQSVLKIQMRLVYELLKSKH